jgi:hypothetical protein
MNMRSTKTRPSAGITTMSFAGMVDSLEHPSA